MVAVHLEIPFKLELEGLQSVNQRSQAGRPVPWSTGTTRSATLIAYSVAGQVGDLVPPLDGGWTSLKIHEDTNGLSLSDQCDRMDDQLFEPFGSLEDFLLLNCETTVDDNGVRFLYVPTHWILGIVAHEEGV